MVQFNRRQWLQFVLGLTIVSGYRVVEKSTVRALEVGEKTIEIRAWTPEGQPLDKESLSQLYFLDLNDEPVFTNPEIVESGQFIINPPAFPFAIALRFPVAGFGKVAIYADNKAQGYTSADFPLNLNLAFADSRLHRVTTYLRHHSQRGINFPESVNDRLQRARNYLDRAQTSDLTAAQIGWCNLSLVESMWAGEVAVFSQAQQEIVQQDKRANFLFGANFFRHAPDKTEYNRRFQELLNFATVPFYWNSFEPQQGQKNFAHVDRLVAWLNQNNITVKGHPLVYFHEAGTPDWLKKLSFAAIKEIIKQHAFEITAHYQAKIAYYDIINEANNIPWANALNFDHEQFLDLTLTVAEASAQGYPQIKRIINHCCAWGENVAYGKPPQDSPFQYLQRCLAAEIPFEIIGLQVYYPNQDMFEINRLLERFSSLNKPIHITELGISSAATIDENSQLKEPRGLWHKPWNEAIQADWLEQFYTLCYSKPYIEAISWWDLADGGNFWPHGGLLNPQMQPKLAYHRLNRLIKKWNINHN